METASRLVVAWGWGGWGERWGCYGSFSGGEENLPELGCADGHVTESAEATGHTIHTSNSPEYNLYLGEDAKQTSLLSDICRALIRSDVTIHCGSKQPA